MLSPRSIATSTQSLSTAPPLPINPLIWGYQIYPQPWWAYFPCWCLSTPGFYPCLWLSAVMAPLIWNGHSSEHLNSPCALRSSLSAIASGKPSLPIPPLSPPRPGPCSLAPSAWPHNQTLVPNVMPTVKGCEVLSLGQAFPYTLHELNHGLLHSCMR